MPNYQSFRELKATARKSLEGNYGRAISILINVEIMGFIPTYITLIFFSGENLFQLISSEIVTFILTAFLQVLQMGVCLFYLKISCGQPASVIDLFFGFRNNRNQALVISLIYSTVSYLCNLPAIIYTYTTAPLNNFIFFLLAISGTLLSNFILIPLCQSYYILLDFPNFSAKQAMRYSIKIMKGNFIRYILFNFSFLPLILISFLCCGVGLLWVLPYMNASLAAFYLDLAKQQQ